MLRLVGLLALLLGSLPLHAQDVLIVTAHPDDEAMFAGTVYGITQRLGGAVDLALVTDGSGGFRYATLAEPLYGLDLDNEAVARQHLPAIRKRELMAGGAYIGLRKYFFLDQYDHAFTTDPDTVLQHVWDADFVRTRLTDIMERGAYDYVLVHLPIDQGFHGHHKAATILALEAAQALPAEARPAVLGAFPGNSTAPETMPQTYEGLPSYPITAVEPAVPVAVFDRTTPLSADARLDHRIIVNWLIAEHKSQGTMQLFVTREEIDLERFWCFAANDPASCEAFAALVAQLNAPAEP